MSLQKKQVPDGSARRSQWGPTVEVISAVLAFLGLVTTGVFSWLSYQNAQDALRVAQEAQKLSEVSAQRRLAGNFYLGAVPGSFVRAETESDQAPINSNIVAIYSVRVEGTVRVEGEERPHPASINIWTVQACTGYTLPAEFTAHRVLFSDGTQAWSRDADGRLEPAPLADLSTDTHDAYRTFEVAGCS